MTTQKSSIVPEKDMICLILVPRTLQFVPIPSVSLVSRSQIVQARAASCTIAGPGPCFSIAVTASQLAASSIKEPWKMVLRILHGITDPGVANRSLQTPSGLRQSQMRKSENPHRRYPTPF